MFLHLLQDIVFYLLVGFLHELRGHCEYILNLHVLCNGDGCLSGEVELEYEVRPEVVFGVGNGVVLELSGHDFIELFLHPGIIMFLIWFGKVVFVPLRLLLFH